MIKGFLKQATAMFITLQTTSVSEQRVSYCINVMLLYVYSTSVLFLLVCMTGILNR